MRLLPNIIAKCQDPNLSGSQFYHLQNKRVGHEVITGLLSVQTFSDSIIIIDVQHSKETAKAGVSVIFVCRGEFHEAP